MCAKSLDGREIQRLSDAELAELAWQQRRKALHGDRKAYGIAHELEKELRSREAAVEHASVLRPKVEPEPPEQSRRWWQFYR